ncbi:MAG TPA: adenylate/guanylate cyclase domain-containing protein [Xanthobacteraceae bacterium]|nr:adenylate/guanylate cyclase domain-containing protein [Xanthobacteraceae bacterium]
MSSGRSLTTRFLRLARRLLSARALAAALLAALLSLRVTDPGPLQELRLQGFDLLQRLHPRDASERPVVIVDIDERSLRELGQWPWPRTLVADLIARLHDLGAVTIGFDFMFAEPDRLSPALAVDAFRNLDDDTRNRLRALPSNDAVMAQAMQDAKIVLGESGILNPAPQAERLPVGLAAIGPDPRSLLFNFPGLLRSIPALDEAAAGRGLLNIRTERDGIVRRVPMVMTAQDQMLPSLTFEMLRVGMGASTILIRSDEDGVQSVAIPPHEIPTDRNGQLWIHFAPHDQARYVSAVDVIEGRIDRNRFAGRLVLVGTSAAGLLDLKTTPVDPAMPGVEVHAQVLENILSNAMLSAPNDARTVELIAALVLGLAIVALAPVLGPALLLSFGAAFVALLLGASWYFFTQQKLLIDATFPLLSSLLVYLTLVFANFVKEQHQRRQIRSAFGQYLSPALVEQLAQSPEKLVLGGEQRDMTIMFSDVRGFTTISEVYKDDPQGLTALMNSFLTPLTNAIIDRKGTIDKYMGDAIMAFWNAPLYDPTHELNACEAALDMLDRVDALNGERERAAAADGTPFIPIRIGVGINTGPCVVGNMGSDLRFDYSVLGDSVNLASRLEGQCKSYGLPIIIGSRTAQAAKDRFAILELDFIAVKGKKEPEVVYAIVGRADMAQSERFRRWRELNMTMLSLYRSRDWKGALAAIEDGRAADEDGRFTTLYTVYAERIRAFQESPPPDDWDGAYALETK